MAGYGRATFWCVESAHSGTGIQSYSCSFWATSLRRPSKYYRSPKKPRINRTITTAPTSHTMLFMMSPTGGSDFRSGWIANGMPLRATMFRKTWI